MAYNNYENLIKSICNLRGIGYQFKFITDRYQVNHTKKTVSLPKKIANKEQFIKSLYTIGLIMHEKRKDKNLEWLSAFCKKIGITDIDKYIQKISIK